MPNPIFDAIETQSLSKLSEALKDASIIDSRDEYGETPLMHVVKSWQEVEAVRQLIDAGADVQAKDKDGETALHYAARLTSNSRIVEMLIDAGADVNSQEHDEITTPLISALESNREYSLIKEMIRAGADVNRHVRNIITDEHWTPLMVACVKSNDPEIVSLLMESGAKCNVFDEEGNTPYSLANKNAALHGTAVLDKLRDCSPSEAQARALQHIKDALDKSSKARLVSARTMSILIASESMDYFKEQLRSYSQMYGYEYIEVTTKLFTGSNTDTITNLRKLKDVYKVLFIGATSTGDLNENLSPFDSLLLNGSFGVVSNAPETTFTNDPIIVVGIRSEDFSIKKLDHHMLDRFWRVVVD